MVGVDMMMLWWQYDDHFLKASNFEQALGPGEDVVEVSDVLPLQHLGRVFFFFIGHLFLLVTFLLVTCFY